jgi:glycosyltransferase involved in cell wall biosynthesis
VQLPRITVVTPCLDAAATLPECLESVRGQGYPDLEHVVVDGGSTDGTLDIVRGAEGVQWISEPDEGRPDAANKGVRMATGEVIGFLNADDRYEPGALQAVGEAFARDPEAMWVTGFSFPLYLTQNFVSDPATFVRRAALDEVGPLENRYRISHDYDLWLRVARRWHPIVLERYLSSFRMVEGTLSMAGFERQFREHQEVARLRGDGHRLPVAVNAVMSRLIVLAYRAMRTGRRLRNR